MMVVIEGLDLVGKTTIAKTVSAMDGWQYYKTPPENYREECIKLGVDGLPVYTEERFRLFIRCLEFSSQEILKQLAKGTSVVVDRWIWTTLAYFFAFNGGLENKLRGSFKSEIAFIAMPQLSFLVHIVDETVFESRKEKRKELSPYDKEVVNDKHRREAIFNNYLLFNPDFVLIDNTSDFSNTMEKVFYNILREV